LTIWHCILSAELTKKRHWAVTAENTFGKQL